MEQKFIVDGFVFETEKQASQAKKELEGVRYIKENLDMNNPTAVLGIYNRILRERMFATPVGYNFLRELQEYLFASPVIRNKEIHPIDFSPVVERAKQDDKEAIRLQKTKAKERYKEKEKLRKENKKQKLIEEKKSDTGKYKQLFYNSMLVNVALLIVIVAMFLLVHFSDIPTIINYENKLIDRYEDWEQQLKEREERIRAYEEKYQITDGYQQ